MNIPESRDDVAKLLRDHQVELSEGMSREDIEEAIATAIAIADHNGRDAILQAIGSAIPAFNWLSMLASVEGGEVIAAQAILAAASALQEDLRNHRRWISEAAAKTERKRY